MLKYLLAALALITAPAAYGDSMWSALDFECDPDSNYLYFGYVAVYYDTLEEARGTELPSNRAFKEEDWSDHRQIVSFAEGITFEHSDGPTWFARSIDEDEHPIVVSCVLSYPTEIGGIQTDVPLEFEVRRTGRMIVEGSGHCGARMTGGFEVLLNGLAIEAWPGDRDVCRAFQNWDRFKSIEYSGSDGFNQCQRIEERQTVGEPPHLRTITTKRTDCDTTTPDFPATPPAE